MYIYILIYKSTYFTESKNVPNLDNKRVKQTVNPEEYVEYNSEDILNEIEHSLKKFEEKKSLENNVTANEDNYKNKNSTESTTKKGIANTSQFNLDGTEHNSWDLDDLTETLVRHVFVLVSLIQKIPNCLCAV